MRKCTAIFMLSIFIFSSTAVHELGKIGVLVSHFKEHQLIDSSITVLDFLQIHYFSGNIYDDDYDRDMQLPFKTVDCSTTGIAYILPPTLTPVLLPPPFLVNKRIAPRAPSFSPSSHFSDIWQPPKNC